MRDVFDRIGNKTLGQVAMCNVRYGIVNKAMFTLYIPQRTYSGNTADLFGTTDLFGQYTGSIRAEYKQTHLAGKLHTRYRIISQQGDTKRQNLHQQSNVKII